MGRKIIKWGGFLLALVVLVSLYYYVREKKHEPLVSSDELLKNATIEIREKKNYPKAIILLREALRSAPKYADVRAALGRAYFLNGQPDSAKKYLLSALRYDKKNESSLLNLVGVSLTEKDTVAAIQYLSKYLSYYPKDAASWRKKYTLQLQRRQYADAEISYHAFAKRFPIDTLRRIAADYWQTYASEQKIRGNLSGAYRSYQRALAYQPNDPRLLDQLVILGLQQRDYGTAKRYNDVLLRKDSSNNRYRAHAYAIAMRGKDTAAKVETALKAYTRNPSDATVEKDLTDLYVALAAGAKGEDKVAYATRLLRIRPNHREGWLYTINGLLEMSRYNAALDAADKALHHYPSDQLFINKKIGILTEKQDFTAAANYLENLLQNNPSSQYRKVFSDLMLQTAVAHIRAGRTTEAEMHLQKGLAYAPDSRDLLEQLVNVHALQGNTSLAIHTIDRLITLAPSDPAYLFKKAGLLEKQERFEDAAALHYGLYHQYPGSHLYRNAYLEALNSAQRQQARALKWDSVIAIYNRASAIGKTNRNSLQYVLAAYTELGDHTQALALTDTALALYPGDSLFRTRQSLAYHSLGRHAEGLTIGKSLLEKYPSDTGLQKMYLDQLLITGKYYARTDQHDSALAVFFTAYRFLPNDTFALQNLSAIYFVKRQYDSSIYYANLGLGVDSHNTYLLMKKASSYEQLKDYRSAYTAATRVWQLDPSDKVSDYRAYLKSKTYRNQAGVSQLRSFFSTEGQYTSVTTVHYMRKFDRASVMAKLALGSRPIGTGIQGGLDAYYTHNSRYYSNAFLNTSSGKAFPNWQTGYSLFRNFKKGWEAEAGGRYTGFDSIHVFTAIGAVGKYVKNAWVNLRGFYSYDNQNWYPSVTLTARQYLNDKNDYVSMIAGSGRIPNDPGLVYNLNNFRGYRSNTIGAGFQKTFGYSTVLQGSFNYTQLSIPAKQSINQYDIYLSLFRNF